MAENAFGAIACRGPLQARNVRNALLTSTVLSAGILSGLSSQPAHAQTWTGANSSSWFNPSNWSTNSIPGSTSTAVIAQTLPNPTAINGGSATSYILNVGVGGAGDLTVQNGTLTIMDQAFPFTSSALNIGGSDTSPFSANSIGTLRVLAGGVVDTSGNPTAQSPADSAADFRIGFSGAGALQVANGGIVKFQTIRAGGSVGSSGAIAITGAGSSLLGARNASLGLGSANAGG